MSENNPPASDDCIVDIESARAFIGTASALISKDGEAPLRRQTLPAYRIEKTTVSNQRFEHFVNDTGYVTEAEEIGWSFAFLSHLPSPEKHDQRAADAQWWRQVEGANWRCINGPQSESDWRPDHPVVQVSKRDADAFASWAGGRLPTEAEWEHAARGGLGDVRFPWGDQEPDDDNFQPCNIWQGRFPHHNLALDGYPATAPVKSFDPNGYGLYNMCGNVWEWTASPFKLRSLSARARKKERSSKNYFTMKGGSFMCHKSYCFRYRIAARSGTSADSATSHQGFRLAYDSNTTAAA